MAEESKQDKWSMESQEFLDALTGGKIRVLNIRENRDPEGPRNYNADLEYIRRTSGGRPRNNAPVTDPLTTYNFKIRRSVLERLRGLSGDMTRTMQSLLTEAVEDLITKYREEQENEKAEGHQH